MDENRVRDLISDSLKEKEDDIKELTGKISQLEIENGSLKVFRSFTLWITGSLLVPFFIWTAINITTLSGQQSVTEETFKNLPSPSTTENLDKRLQKIDREVIYMEMGLITISKTLHDQQLITEKEYEYFLNLKK